MIANVIRLRHRATHYVVNAWSTRPTLYFGLRSVTGKEDGLCLSLSTDIVIEGFPRSANSTTVHRFRALQTKPLQVAHHKHHAAQVLRAVEWELPAIVLIRRASDAIVSLLALAQEVCMTTGRRGRGQALRFQDAAWAWSRFYDTILPKRCHVVVGRFETVTQDLGPVIAEVNARWSTAFRTKAPEAAEAPLTLGWHATPTTPGARSTANCANSFRRRPHGPAG